jgi:cyanate permease
MVSIPNSQNNGANSRWYALILAALTATFAVAVPQICMTVLFKEISEDLGLSLVQIGIIWGTPAFSALVIVFFGGMLSDRYGAKRVIGIACLLAGIAGALRGTAGGFTSLLLFTFFFGMAIWIIPSNLFKTTAGWFSGRQLVVANGTVSAGMAFGFTVGALISASLLSPWLGGWRNVLFLYGAVSVIAGLLWLLTGKEPERVGAGDSRVSVPLRQSMSHVISVKNIWLIGLTFFGYSGCIQGMMGYFPTYLSNNGWTVASAGGTVAAFNGVSTLGAIPLALLASRLGLRKAVLFPVLAVAIAGIALLPLVGNAVVWVLMIIVGCTRDGFMAVCFTMSTETEGIGPVYAGTAMGLVLTVSNIGTFISPPLGNSLANPANPAAPYPFFLWAAFGLLALVVLVFVKESGWKQGELQR